MTTCVHYKIGFHVAKIIKHKLLINRRTLFMYLAYIYYIMSVNAKRTYTYSRI